MKKAMDLAHARHVIWLVQEGAQLVALRVFAWHWLGANLYAFVAWAMLALGKASGSNAEALFNPAVIGFLMMFAFPLVAIGIFITYYLALALSIVSMRPLPLLLSGVAWLSHHQFIPTGQFAPWKVWPQESASMWLYPVLYSALSILCIVWVSLRWDSSRDDYG